MVCIQNIGIGIRINNINDTMAASISIPWSLGLKHMEDLSASANKASGEVVRQIDMLGGEFELFVEKLTKLQSEHESLQTQAKLAEELRLRVTALSKENQFMTGLVTQNGVFSFVLKWFLSFSESECCQRRDSV